MSLNETNIFQLRNKQSTLEVGVDRRNDATRNVNNIMESVENGEFHCHRVVDVRDVRPRNQLIAVSIICTLFMIAEIVGGILSHSLALITDATHLASDLTGFLVSLLAIWLAEKNATTKMNFGYYRTEVLGAVLSILIIWVATGILLFMAIHRVIHNKYEIDADKMLITACCGVLFNIIMGLMLHFGCSGSHLHNHSHGISSDGHGHHQPLDSEDTSDRANIIQQQYAEDSSMHESIQSTDSDLHHDNTHLNDNLSPLSRNRNINIRAAFIHVVGDLIQSVGVCVAAVIIKLKPNAQIADPICTFLFSILVLFTTVTVLRDATLILLEGVPRGVNYRSIRASLLALPGVHSIHSLHIWTLTMNKNVTTVHIVIDDDADPKTVIAAATRLLQNGFSMFRTTIQVENAVPRDVNLDCLECVGPNI